MIYDQLPSIFLTAIASSKGGSVNASIATYIIEHINELEDIGIQELADKNHVSISSISRFVKDIGLNDYSELKELINTTSLSFTTVSNNISPTKRKEDYIEAVVNSLNTVKDSVDLKKIDQLCHDIDHYHRIACFGLLKSSGVALNMQSDLLMLKKLIYTNISFSEQLDYLSNCSSNDLIIIFSYTGSYFDAVEFRKLHKQLKAPRIWMITSVSDHYPDFVDEIITFDSLKDQLSHPYQLQLVEGLITQQYSYYLKTKK